MKTKHLLSVLILGVGIIVSLSIAGSAARAQTPTAPAVDPAANIQYPVAELGNCASKAACKTYCDDSAHSDACLSFAQSHNLMSPDEIQAAKNFAATGNQGPGGCTSQESCQQYCDGPSHIDECISFAETHNLMSASELAQAQKVQAAIKSGVKPPACSGKDACDQYCTSPEHVEECMTFSKAAGLMTPEEAQNSDKVIAAIKSGVKPPACKGSECDQYCSSPEHAEECIAFSEAAGFMTPEQAVIARKTGGKGPGGCVGKDQCDAFCNNPDNQETCFNFAKDNNIISQGQIQQVEQGKQRFADSLNQASPQTLTCIQNIVGADNLAKYKSGTLPPQNIGDKIGQCFGPPQNPSNGGPGAGGNIPPAGGGQINQAPGSASSSQPGQGNVNPGGQMMPQQAGPGGCKTPEECNAFCTANPDACKNFQPSGEPGNQPGQIQGGAPGDFQNFIEGAAGRMMQGIQSGAPQTPQCAPGTECEPGPNQPMGPNQPGNFIQTQPGSFEPSEGRMQPMQTGTPEGGTPPAGVIMQPGTDGGPATQQIQQQLQQFQSPPPPGGQITPPQSGVVGPPPPAGGSLIQSIQSFFGF